MLKGTAYIYWIVTSDGRPQDIRWRWRIYINKDRTVALESYNLYTSYKNAKTQCKKYAKKLNIEIVREE